MIELQAIEPRPFFPTYAWVMDLPPETYEPLNQQLARDLNQLTAPRPQIIPSRISAEKGSTVQSDPFAGTTSR